MIFPSLSRAGALRAALLVVLCAAVPAALAAPSKAAKKKEGPAYRSAIVVDAASGNVLFEDNADEVGAPASMTKLMTFAVLADKLAAGEISLAQQVPIERIDAKMAGTQVYLDPRETFTVEELIYAMMIQSANDAAHALGRVAGGSREQFVALMNAKARELGMTRTTFRSPHGLPPESRKLHDGDVTTARDFALLCRHLVLKTDVTKYTAVREREFGPLRAKGPMRMENHNKLLGKVAGVDGLKTGYTKGAGYCISVTAERNGRRLILVIMGSMGRNGEADMGRVRDAKAIELLEKGFAALPAGSPTFTAERAKHAGPRVIPLDGPEAPAEPAAAAPADAGPSISFPTPRK